MGKKNKIEELSNIYSDKKPSSSYPLFSDLSYIPPPSSILNLTGINRVNY